MYTWHLLLKTIARSSFSKTTATIWWTPPLKRRNTRLVPIMTRRLLAIMIRPLSVQAMQLNSSQVPSLISWAPNRAWTGARIKKPRRVLMSHRRPWPPFLKRRPSTWRPPPLIMYITMLKAITMRNSKYHYTTSYYYNCYYCKSFFYYVDYYYNKYYYLTIIICIIIVVFVFLLFLCFLFNIFDMYFWPMRYFEQYKLTLECKSTELCIWALFTVSWTNSCVWSVYLN